MSATYEKHGKKSTNKQVFDQNFVSAKHIASRGAGGINPYPI
jgi:hypothetical protein